MTLPQKRPQRVTLSLWKGLPPGKPGEEDPSLLSGLQFWVKATCIVHVHARTSDCGVSYDPDSPFLPRNPAPRTYAEYVEWAVNLARLQGREPATPSQAREFLGLLPALHE